MSHGSVERYANASTTDIESASAQTRVSGQEISATFEGKGELLLAMVSQLSGLADPVRDLATRNADQALKGLEADEGKSLRTVLLRVGGGVMSALMSRSGLALYKVAVSESSRFVAAANACGRAAGDARFSGFGRIGVTRTLAAKLGPFAIRIRR